MRVLTSRLTNYQSIERFCLKSLLTDGLIYISQLRLVILQLNYSWLNLVLAIQSILLCKLKGGDIIVFSSLRMV